MRGGRGRGCDVNGWDSDRAWMVRREEPPMCKETVLLIPRVKV